MLHAGVVLQDRYEIIKMIGKGGMSTVYQARDVITKKILAIKDVERSGKDTNRVVETSLAAEGRMLKQLSNPHLPHIYDIIENRDNFMLVMDYIEGESLDKVIAREGAQPMERVLDWGMQICEVFDYLHNQPTPIIYRDMKPANVMLQPNGQLMMIDFGTARTEKIGVSMQADTICIGTAGFAAPEQFGGIGQSTARTDVFCLGGTLYNLITGHSPCDKPVGIRPLGEWNPALENTPIAEIIYKCTRPDPDARYQTAMELHEDLRLASIGAYQSKKQKGNGPNSGNLWQRQDTRGMGMISNGLSGLIQGIRSETSGSLQKKQQTQNTNTGTAVQQEQSGWQHQSYSAGAVQTQTQHTEYATEEADSFLHKLITIAVMVALIFVVLTVVLLVLNATGAAVVFLLIALAAAVCALVCMMKYKNQ